MCLYFVLCNYYEDIKKQCSMYIQSTNPYNSPLKWIEVIKKIYLYRNSSLFYKFAFKQNLQKMKSNLLYVFFILKSSKM